MYICIALNENYLQVHFYEVILEKQSCKNLLQELYNVMIRNLIKFS